MSEMEAAKGVLKRSSELEDLEEQCELTCYRNSIAKMDGLSWKETLMEHNYDELDEKYIVLKGNLYEHVSKKEIDPYGFSEVSVLPGGYIEYFCMWYNGGGSLDEVIEAALDD